MKPSFDRIKDTDMYKAILTIKSEDECRRFFEDLCSPRELSSMEQRYEVARLLMQDNVYTKILEITGASSATISRVRRNILDDRGAGALKAIVERRFEEDKKDG
ncbi:MAG: TrpR-like protein [Clostridia bacterium]|nr:TrpR-like protein [Clostridia bacterium]